MEDLQEVASTSGTFSPSTLPTILIDEFGIKIISFLCVGYDGRCFCDGESLTTSPFYFTLGK